MPIKAGTDDRHTFRIGYGTKSTSFEINGTLAEARGKAGKMERNSQRGRAAIIEKWNGSSFERVDRYKNRFARPVGSWG